VVGGHAARRQRVHRRRLPRADAIRYFAGEITRSQPSPRTEDRHELPVRPGHCGVVEVRERAVGKLSTVLDADTPYISTSGCSVPRARSRTTASIRKHTQARSTTGRSRPSNRPRATSLTTRSCPRSRTSSTASRTTSSHMRRSMTPTVDGRLLRDRRVGEKTAPRSRSITRSRRPPHEPESSVATTREV